MEMSHKHLISIVAPCYNEEACIDIFVERIKNVFKNIPLVSYEIIFINDGSRDDTLGRMLYAHQINSNITIIDLSRNFGKEAALTAGLDIALGDAAIPIDIDLQDPPELIPEMISKWQEGFDVVLAHRIRREHDSFPKRGSARLFYGLHNFFSDQSIPKDVGDFRLLDRKVIDALKMLPENNRFMKGIFAWLGFKTASIDYMRPGRVRGISKFRAWKLWNLALEGITSFSTMPLRIWTYLGLFFAMMAFIYGNIILWRTIILGVDVPGYASIIVTIVFLGGLQLIGIGILGEYLGRTYLEAKRRPVYLVNKIYTSQCRESLRRGDL